MVQVMLSSRELRLPSYVCFTSALHTQYNVRTDVPFLWTLCSCPQVGKETVLIPRSQWLICEHSIIRRCSDYIFGTYMFIHILGTTGSCPVYMSCIPLEARSHARVVSMAPWSPCICMCCCTYIYIYMPS